jgi:Rad52/22 family double-strand break repair protein
VSTNYPDLFAALAAPFDPTEVKALSKSGRQIHYVTARTVMNRLDAVVGPENWWDRYRTGGENSVVCALTVRLPCGAEVTKEDAGGFAGMADSGDDDKSAYSDAFKRAAAKFLVARYLYRDGVPYFHPAADIATDGGRPSPVSTPEPRAEPVPSPVPTPAPRPAASLGWVHGDTVPAPEARNGNDPASGKSLFGWVKDMEKRYDVGLLKYLNQWGRLQDFPGRMVDWDPDQVRLAYAESRRKLASLRREPEPAAV